MTFAAFLEQYAVVISLVVAGILLLILLLLVVFTKRPQVQEEVAIGENDFIAALGGKANVTDLTLRGSRLSVVLNDQSKINEAQLKKHGVSRVITMQDKLILLVEEALKEKLQKLL